MNKQIISDKDEIKRLKRELEKVNQKLKIKESFFESITENTLAGYWIWHIKEDKMYLSPKLKSTFGFKDDELENSSETINKLMHPSDLPDAYAKLGKHIETNGVSPYKIEARFLHRDGSIVWVICSGNIVQWDENGEPSVVIGCHTDNTELKKAENNQKYLDELERKNRELEQFAYISSHDLQEPLNTIRGFVELISSKLEDQQDPEIQKYVEYIQSGTHRMSSLIKSLLEYSRIGKQAVMKKVDCQSVVNEVKDDLSLWIKDSKAKITIGKLPGVMGYDMEMRILFQNLISNALKFRREESPVIEINSELENGLWKFSVADNGIGIDTRHSEKIFKLFQRLHNREEYEGYGLGLAQCHKIVTELHNGSIWVESQPGKGSTFYFTIPEGI
mgnify:CR=1 FL=1